MILSLIFGWLRVLSVLSARQDWSICALDDVRERSFDHTFCLSSSEKVLVDNCDMDIQPPGTNSYFAGNSSLLPQPINVVHGKVRLQMVLRTLEILIFIMIPSSGNDIIVSTVAVGPYRLIDVWCDECFC